MRPGWPEATASLALRAPTAMDPALPTPADDKRNTILVVDDTSANLAVMGELLSPLYRVRVANSGQRALAAVHSPPRPDPARHHDAGAGRLQRAGAPAGRPGHARHPGDLRHRHVGR